jgi:tripartite-type tricarboxylate transporter receptor subunit TctC
VIEVTDFWIDIASKATPDVKAGRLRTFGVTGAQRSAALPEAPTIAEAGMPGYEYTTWYGLLVPARTPRAAIEKLHATTVSLLNSPELKQRYASQGMDPIPSAPEALSARLKSEIEK